MMNSPDPQASLTSIAAIEIAPPGRAIPGARIRPRDPEAEATDPWNDLRDATDDNVAAVNASNLIAFVEGLSKQEKSDVLDSTQFAARAADAKFERKSEIRDWYNYYAVVLEKLGWVSEAFAFKQSEHSEGTLKMSQEAISIISAVATGNQLAILQATLDSLGKMADDSRQIRLFDFNISFETGGNFQIGAAESAGDGVIGMAMGAFFYKSNDTRRNVLFFGWGSQDVEMWAGAQRFVLNSEFYAPLRDTVRSRLGASSADFVATIPIL